LELSLITNDSFSFACHSKLNCGFGELNNDFNSVAIGKSFAMILNALRKSTIAII
jgi:hypothetical protein